MSILLSTRNIFILLICAFSILTPYFLFGSIYADPWTYEDIYRYGANSEFNGVIKYTYCFPNKEGYEECRNYGSGTIVNLDNNYYLVTAAHVVNKDDNYHGRIRIFDEKSDGSFTVGAFSKIFRHQQCQWEYDRYNAFTSKGKVNGKHQDIAVVFLEGFSASEGLTNYKLYSDNLSKLETKILTSVGYGQIFNYRKEYYFWGNPVISDEASFTRQAFDIEIGDYFDSKIEDYIQTDHCLFSKCFSPDENYDPTGNPRGMITGGDSGGPLFYKNVKGELELVAVASFTLDQQCVNPIDMQITPLHVWCNEHYAKKDTSMACYGAIATWDIVGNFVQEVHDFLTSIRNGDLNLIKQKLEEGSLLKDNIQLFLREAIQWDEIEIAEFLVKTGISKVPSSLDHSITYDSSHEASKKGYFYLCRMMLEPDEGFIYD